MIPWLSTGIDGCGAFLCFGQAGALVAMPTTSLVFNIYSVLLKARRILSLMKWESSLLELLVSFAGSAVSVLFWRGRASLRHFVPPRKDDAQQSTPHFELPLPQIAISTCRFQIPRRLP